MTGALVFPSFPQTLEGERILREPATANGPTVLPRQYFRQCGQRTKWLSYPTVYLPFDNVRWLGNRKEIEEQTKTWDKKTIVDRESDLQNWVELFRQFVSRNLKGLCLREQPLWISPEHSEIVPPAMQQVKYREAARYRVNSLNGLTVRMSPDSGLKHALCIYEVLCKRGSRGFQRGGRSRNDLPVVLLALFRLWGSTDAPSSTRFDSGGTTVVGFQQTPLPLLILL
ncbi:MAG: hypothetical protein DMG49_24260 [Acidobacteria bacterium]|nr:MAG: hypothetical protein DMG49_24260 [Acidobacteriota bacterium]